MWKATSGSLALRSELLPCALQIPSHDGHPALGYTTRLAFSRGRTSTCKSMVLHGTQQKGPAIAEPFLIYMPATNSTEPNHFPRLQEFSCLYATEIDAAGNA